MHAAEAKEAQQATIRQSVDRARKPMNVAIIDAANKPVGTTSSHQEMNGPPGTILWGE
jgi:hypothetical protein